MERFTFYIGFTNDSKESQYRHQIMFKGLKFVSYKKANKFLNAMKEIFNYIRKGHIYD